VCFGKLCLSVNSVSSVFFYKSAFNIFKHGLISSPTVFLIYIEIFNNDTHKNTRFVGLWKCGTTAQYAVFLSAKSWVLSGCQSIYSY
jgi:hypothetical protein